MPRDQGQQCIDPCPRLGRVEESVVEHRAATVIIDVTGVPVVDTHVAGALVQASKGVRLLGATAVLTGIRPEVARTLVSMGAELGDIVVHGTLRGGIAYALKSALDDSD